MRTAGVALVACVLAGAGGLGQTRSDAREGAPPLRPFAEYEPAGFVVMSARDDFGAASAKRTLARHLPAGVTLVLYGSDDPRQRAAALESYAPFIAADRVRYLVVRKAGVGFWTRDGLPFPAVDQDGRLVLIDARYRSGFEPDADLAAFLDVPLLAHGRRFDGGNLVANDRGDCLIVQAGSAKSMPDAVFASHYGCRAVVRLPRDGGMGHADERVRFVDAGTVLTDAAAYVAPLAARGFRVVLLPRADGRRESYVNSLVINGTAFVPQFRRSTDGQALEVYRRVGLTAVGLDARTLAGRGHGSIHCITMSYPRLRPAAQRVDSTMPLRRLRSAVSADRMGASIIAAGTRPPPAG